MSKFIIRITDYYCNIVYKSMYKNTFKLPLTITIGPNCDTVKYFDTDKFSCFLYDRKRFETYSDILSLSYEDAYCGAIMRLFKIFYKKCVDQFNKINKITIIYDENVINTFGKSLYDKALNFAKNYINEKYGIVLNFNFVNIENAYYGHILRDELNIYHLYTTENNLLYNDIKKCDSLEGEKKIAYVLTNYEHDRKDKPKRYYILTDVHANESIYYTYLIDDLYIKLVNKEVVNVGMMDIYNWFLTEIYGNEKDEYIYYTYEEIMTRIGYLNSYYPLTYGFSHYTKEVSEVVKISNNSYYLNSPIRDLTFKMLQIQRSIKDNNYPHDDIEINYDIESYGYIIFKHHDF